MFRLVKIENGRTNEAEPVKLGVTPQETYTLGEALVLSGGLATKCAPTTKPAFIAGEDFTAPATWIAPPNNRSFSVKVVLPASG